MRIVVVNGPNLNFLGVREPEVYGKETYEQLCQMLQENANRLQIELSIFQENGEGEIIDRLQQAFYEKTDGIIINPGAYTHYSYAIRDALMSLPIKKIEVHLSNIFKREDFRRESVTAAACDGMISGFGFQGYLLAMEALLK